MTRRRRPRKKLVDFSGTRKTIDILRDGYYGLDRIQSRMDAEAESTAHEAELRRCRYDVILLPAFDPRHIASQRRLRFISSRPYWVWRKTKLGLKSFGRIFGHELILAFLIPLQLLLIVVFNVVAFLLVWWLLFSF